MAFQDIESITFRCERCGHSTRLETHTLEQCPCCGYTGRCKRCGYETFDDDHVLIGDKCIECYIAENETKGD